MIDPATPIRDVFKSAAAGDPDAQGAMMDHLLATPLMTPEAALLSAEWWARAASAHGRPIDRHRLVYVLMIAAGIQEETGFRDVAVQSAGEAVAILDRLGDEGDQAAEVALARLTAALVERGMWNDVKAHAKALQTEGAV